MAFVESYYAAPPRGRRHRPGACSRPAAGRGRLRQLLRVLGARSTTCQVDGRAQPGQDGVEVDLTYSHDGIDRAGDPAAGGGQHRRRLPDHRRPGRGLTARTPPHGLRRRSRPGSRRTRTRRAPRARGAAGSASSPARRCPARWGGAPRARRPPARGTAAGWCAAPAGGTPPCTASSTGRVLGQSVAAEPGQQLVATRPHVVLGHVGGGELVLGVGAGPEAGDRRQVVRGHRGERTASPSRPASSSSNHSTL